MIDRYYINTFNDQIFELSPNGTFYVYAQRRVGMVGTQGPKSDIGSISYNDAGSPLEPVDFVVTAVDFDTITFTWTANVEPDMDHYDLEISTDASTYTLVDTIDSVETSYEDLVEEDNTYYYRLYAVDQSDNRSTPALGVVSTPVSTELPPNPIEVSVPQSEAAINVLWARPPSLSFEKIDYWVITYVALDTDGSELESTEESIIVNRNLYNDRIDDLSIGQRYKVTLRTVDTKGRESTGVSMNVTPQPSAAPRDPHDITMTMEAAPSSIAVGGVQVNLSWVDGDNPYDPAVSYRYTIYTTISGQAESVGHNVPIGATEEQIVLYQIGDDYFAIPEQTLVTFRITAHDHAGFESFGSYTRKVTSLFSAATRLGNPQAEFDFDTGRVTVTWDNQSDTDDVRILVLDSDLEDAYFSDLEIINSQLGKVERFVFDAELDHRYTITLTPYNIKDIPGPSSTVVELTFIAGGLDPPEIPQDIEVKSNDRQVRLSWTASPSPFTEYYRIYRMEGNVILDYSLWTLLDTLPKDIMVFTEYGLDNDQVYSYYITAFDVYGRESPHLIDDAFNLNFVEAIPKREGVLTEPTNLDVTLIGNNILLTWETLLEEFDGFTIYRSINNLHEWTTLVTVDRDVLSYTDTQLPSIDGTTFYYMIDKTVNDSDIVVQTTNVAPENSIFLAEVVHDATSLVSTSVTNRRDIADMIDPLAEYTSQFLLPHKHIGLGSEPTRVDLNPELIITDWETIDGRIFTTDEDDILGTSYVVKIDGRFPSVFFQIDATNRRLVFSETIVEVDNETGNVVGEVPDIEVKVLGVEEVQSVLPDFRFDDIHARQIQFGILNAEQLPDINHEGRIRESLLPKRYLLERFSNHNFVVPQNNTDDTKTFGDGTTFYAITESDGKIQEVIDFDTENDEAMVGFMNPAFSSTTLEHLKQNALLSDLMSANDNANYYIFDPDRYYASPSDTAPINLRGDIYSVDINNDSWTNLTGLFSTTGISSIVLHDSSKEGYALSSLLITRFDVATGELFDSITTDTLFVAAYNSDDGKIYSADATTNIQTVDPITGVTTVVGPHGVVAPLAGMAYDSNSGTMYILDVFRWLYTIDLTTGAATIVAGPITMPVSPVLSMSFDESTNRLYSGDATPPGRLAYIQLPAFGTNILTDPTSFSFYSLEFPNEDWWIPGSDKLRLGDFTGLVSNTYLRFQINIPNNAASSTSTLHFTAHTESSVGDDVRLRVSVLDPSGIASTTDLQLVSVASVGTLASIDWSPPAWSAEESSSGTSVDVTSLVAAFVGHDNYIPGGYIFLKVETLSTTVSGHHRTAYSYDTPSKAPYLDTNHVFDLAEVNSDPGGFQSEKSYHFKFEFQDTNEERWVRITSFNTPIKPNPILDLNKRLRFRILNQFASVYMCIGIREISVTGVDVGDDGGTTGAIEWIGAGSTISDSEGNLTPVGTRLIPASDDWQEVDINLKKESVVSFENGNAALEGDFGVLEHFAFTVNPDDANGTGPFDIYIDKLEQVSDVLVAGTSQGILLSEDFGTTWELSRLTDTPVHKFYHASNNRFLWAISASEVLLSADPAHWFATSGITGVQYVRDIVEDNEGDIFISSDKGVYHLEIALIKTYASFRQTQPVNAFTTDCYGMYHNPVSSGIDEIWVSTEIGIYKTLDKGDSWEDADMSTGGLVAYEIENISTNTNVPNLIAINRKSVMRRLGRETDFTVIADFEDQHDIFDIWTMGYFSGRLYISTGSGVYMNSQAELFSPGVASIPFTTVFPKLHFNNFTRIAFCLNLVDLGEFGERLFIGQENRLVTADESNVLAVKKEYLNKLLPSFFVDNTQVEIGYIYNAFNNVVAFREPRQVNEIVSAAHLPRKTFFAVQGGWSQTNPSTDIFVYQNGIPTWLDFEYDEPEILSELQIIKGKLEALPTLTSFNSFIPDSQTYKDAVLTDIETITAGGDDDTALVNNSTIIQFMDDYTRFLSLITQQLRTSMELDLPRIQRTGIRREDRSSGSRAALLEEKEGFTSEDSTAITVDVVMGEVDFLAAFSQSTTPTERAKFTFSKYDHLEITIFNANVQNTGEYTHRELENKMEDINTGLTSNLANTAYTDLMKLGVFIDNQHNFFMDVYNVSAIQSRFYGAHNNDWYDILNSTIDYELIQGVESGPEMRFVNTAVIFEDDAYFADKIWIGTDKDILQQDIDSSGVLVAENIISPASAASLIRDIFIFNGDEVYVVAVDQNDRSHLYKTVNFGFTWSDEEIINLPDQIYAFRIINGVKVALTEEGVFYCDNNFRTWYPSDVVPSDVLGEESLALPAFRQRMFNMALSTFLVVESDRWFYTSGAGIEFFAVGRLVNNDATVVNRIVVFKGLTWVATDRGFYHDANSLLSDSVQFTLQLIEDTATASSAIEVNDIAYGVDALYCCASNGKIYRYLDAGDGQEWRRYQVPDFDTIHRIVLDERADGHYLLVMSYNQLKVIDVTPDTGVFG